MDKNVGAEMRFWRSFIYTCINCQNRLFVDIAEEVAEKLNKAKISAFKANGIGADILKVVITLGLMDRRVKVFALKKIRLLEYEDLFKSLADLSEPLAISFLAMF